MRIGIVGSEAAKFTPRGERAAKKEIRRLVRLADEVCSGECPLGGIDIWVREIAEEEGKPFTPFPPKENNWEKGFRPRNQQIARWSDTVACITVKRLPESYKGSRFPICYHCNTKGHIKSGGCWTMRYAGLLGKEKVLIVVSNPE